MSSSLINTGDNPLYQARALRVRTIRGMLRMTLEEFGTFLGYTKTTAAQWETSPIKGLSEKAARNIVERLKDTSVVCGLQWLLHGEGLPPFIRSDNTTLAKYQQELMKLSTGIDITTYTKNEIERFQAFIPNAITLQTPDDSMEPALFVGDVAGGKQLKGEALQYALGKICIVTLKENYLVLRKLFKDDKESGKFKLISLNANSMSPQITAGVSIQSAAPICRVWRTVEPLLQ